MATGEKKLSAECIARLSWNQKDTLTFALSHLKQVNFYGLKGPAIWTSSISSNSVRSTDIAAPKELNDSARGFNPGEPGPPRRTQKGCKVDRPENRAKERNCPILMARASMHEHRFRFESETGTVELGFLSPFQGAPLGGGCLQGLKPQAESWSPFGARNAKSLGYVSWPFGPFNSRKNGKLFPALKLCGICEICVFTYGVD